jgi:hypothetical protein
LGQNQGSLVIHFGNACNDLTAGPGYAPRQNRYVIASEAKQSTAGAAPYDLWIASSLRFSQ